MMTTFDEDLDPLQTLVQPDLTTETPSWCESCQKLRQEISRREEDQIQKFGKLKKKIISTDLLIKKYKTKCEDYEAQQKRTEEAIKRAEKFQRQTEILESQLKTALLDVEPSRQDKRNLEADVKKKTGEIQQLSDQLLSAQGVTVQYEALTRKSSASIDKLEGEKKELQQRVKHLETSKVTKESTKELKSEISCLKKENASLKKTEARLERRLNTLLVKNEQLQQTVRDNKLSPTSHRKKSPSGHFMKSPTRSPRAQKFSPRRTHTAVHATDPTVPTDASTNDQEISFAVLEAEIKASAAEMDSSLSSDDDSDDDVKETEKRSNNMGQRLKDEQAETEQEEDEDDDDTASLCSVKWTFSPVVRCLSPLPSTPVPLRRIVKPNTKHSADKDNIQERGEIQKRELNCNEMAEKATTEIMDVSEDLKEKSNTEVCKTDIGEANTYIQDIDDESIAPVNNEEEENEYKKMVSEDLMDIFSDDLPEKITESKREECVEERNEIVEKGDGRKEGKGNGDESDNAESVCEKGPSRGQTEVFLPSGKSETESSKSELAVDKSLEQNVLETMVNNADQELTAVSNQDTEVVETLNDALAVLGKQENSYVDHQRGSIENISEISSKQSNNVNKTQVSNLSRNDEVCKNDNLEVSQSIRKTNTHEVSSPKTDHHNKVPKMLTAECPSLPSFGRSKEQSCGSLAEEIANLNAVGDYVPLSRQKHYEDDDVDSRTLEKCRQKLRRSKYKDVDGELTRLETNIAEDPLRVVDSQQNTTLETQAKPPQKSNVLADDVVGKYTKEENTDLLQGSDESVEDNPAAGNKGTPKIRRSKRLSSEACAALDETINAQVVESQHESTGTISEEHEATTQLHGSKAVIAGNDMLDKAKTCLNYKRVLRCRKKSATDPSVVLDENAFKDENDMKLQGNDNHVIAKERTIDEVKPVIADASQTSAKIPETSTPFADNDGESGDLDGVHKPSRQMSTGFVVSVSMERMSSTESLASPLWRRTPPSLPSFDTHSVCDTINEEVSEEKSVENDKQLEKHKKVNETGVEKQQNMSETDKLMITKVEKNSSQVTDVGNLTDVENADKQARVCGDIGGVNAGRIPEAGKIENSVTVAKTTSSSQQSRSSQGWSQVFPGTSHSLDSDSEILPGMSRSTTSSAVSLDRTSPLSPLPMSPFDFILPISPLPPSPCRSIERVSPLSSDQDSRLSADVEGLQASIQETPDVVAHSPPTLIIKPLPEVAGTTKSLISLTTDLLSIPVMISPIKTPETRKRKLLSESDHGKSAFYKVSKDASESVETIAERPEKVLTDGAGRTTQPRNEQNRVVLESNTSLSEQHKTNILSHTGFKKNVSNIEAKNVLPSNRVSKKMDFINEKVLDDEPKDAVETVEEFGEVNEDNFAADEVFETSSDVPVTDTVGETHQEPVKCLSADCKDQPIKDLLTESKPVPKKISTEATSVPTKRLSVSPETVPVNFSNVNINVKADEDVKEQSSVNVSTINRNVEKQTPVNVSQVDGNVKKQTITNHSTVERHVKKHTPVNISTVDRNVKKQASVAGTTLDKNVKQQASVAGTTLDKNVKQQASVAGTTLDKNVKQQASVAGTTLDKNVKQQASVAGTTLDKNVKEQETVGCNTDKRSVKQVPEEAPTGHDCLVASKTKHRLAHRPNIQPLRVQKVKVIEAPVMLPPTRKRRSLESTETVDKKSCKDSLFQRHGRSHDKQEYKQMQVFLKSSESAETFVTKVISDTNIDFIARQLLHTCIECLNQVRLDPLIQVYNYCENGNQQVMSGWPCLNVAERQAVSLLIYLLQTMEMGLHNSYVLLKLWEGVFSQDICSHLLGKISLARVFTAICAHQGDVEQARVLLYHIATSNKLSLNPFVVAVVSVWPHVLLMDEQRSAGLVTVLESLVTRSLVEQDTPTSHQMLTVVQKLCKWSPSPVDSSLLSKQLSMRLIDVMMDNPEHCAVFELTKSLHLLSVKEGWAWFRDNIVCRYGLQTVANKYLATKINKPVPPQLVCAVVHTIANIVASLSSSVVEKDLGHMTKTWLIPLMNKAEGDTTVRNCCFQVILELCPFHPPLLQQLLTWMGRNKEKLTLPVHLMKALEIVKTNIGSKR